MDWDLYFIHILPRSYLNFTYQEMNERHMYYDGIFSLDNDTIVNVVEPEFVDVSLRNIDLIFAFWNSMKYRKLVLNSMKFI